MWCYNKAFFLSFKTTLFNSLWKKAITVYQKNSYKNMKFTQKRQKKKRSQHIHSHVGVTAFTRTSLLLTCTSFEAKPSNTSVSESVSSVKILRSSSVRYLDWNRSPCKNTIQQLWEKSDIEYSHSHNKQALRVKTRQLNSTLWKYFAGKACQKKQTRRRQHSVSILSCFNFARFGFF